MAADPDPPETPDDAGGDADARAATEAALRELAATGDWGRVATAALSSYGDEILGYLVAVTRDPVVADEVFSAFLENLWKGLPTFGWRSSFRTWAYVIARNAWHRRGRGKQRTVALDASIEQIAAELRSRTASFLRTDNRERMSTLRAELAPDDQSLLVLRINRGMAWRDIAEVLADAPLAEPELGRRAAALRKRFMRLKDELRARLGKAD